MHYITDDSLSRKVVIRIRFKWIFKTEGNEIHRLLAAIADDLFCALSQPFVMSTNIIVPSGKVYTISARLKTPNTPSAGLKTPQGPPV